MVDNLRESESDRQAFQEAMGLGSSSAPEREPPRLVARSSFLGMSPPQRLVIALLLLLAVCVLGTMCLLVTGRIGAF